MQEEKTAFFVKMSFSLEDLVKPHLASQCKPYVIEKTVTLAKIDFENFINDLCVDRSYIEDNASLCYIDNKGVWHCLFIKQKGKTDGVLVMSEGQNFPKWSAYIQAK